MNDDTFFDKLLTGDFAALAALNTLPLADLDELRWELTGRLILIDSNFLRCLLQRVSARIHELERKEFYMDTED